MGALLANPELIRLLRSKLRPRSMAFLGVGTVLVLAIILVLCYLAETVSPPVNLAAVFSLFFGWVVWLQLGVVTFYGLVQASQGVTQEREKNTYDFQRLVAMGPRALAIGKILGQPCEAFFIVLCATPFALLAVLGANAGLDVFVKSQAIVLLSGLLLSALGLMISTLMQKTARASGIGVLIPLLYLVLFIQKSASSARTVWHAAVPTHQLALVQEAFINTGASPAHNWFGFTIPSFAWFVILNALLTLLFAAIATRRLTDEEYSTVAPWHAVPAFLVFQILLLGDYIPPFSFESRISEIYGGIVAAPDANWTLRETIGFHVPSLLILFLAAFGLTPSAEVLRARVHRARRNEHWRICFERPTRLNDSTALLPMVALVGIYAASWFVLSRNVRLGAASGQAAAVVPMVGGLAFAVAALLLYIQAYSERSGFRLAIGLLLIASIVPPVAVGLLADWEHTPLVSAFAYFEGFGRSSAYSTPGIGPTWTFPLICTALAVLLTVLAAMRIRFMLDMCELEAKKAIEEAPMGQSGSPSTLTTAQAALARARMQADTPPKLESKAPQTGP